MAKVVSYSQGESKQGYNSAGFRIAAQRRSGSMCNDGLSAERIIYLRICATPYHSLPYRIEIINIFCKKYRKWGVEKNGSKCYACTDQDRFVPFQTGGKREKTQNY